MMDAIWTNNKLILILKLILISIFFAGNVSEANAGIYCKYFSGKSYPAHQCFVGQVEISRNEFCVDQQLKPNLEQYVIDKHCSNDLTGPIYTNTTDERVCKMLIRKDGSIDHESDKAKEEAVKRDLSLEDCKILTGRYTKEELAYIKKELEVAQKKERISQLKSDCSDIGFTDGTEAMGNCVLKMMEIESKSFTAPIVSTNSNIDNEMVNIEKQKLKAQREALKIQQDQLKAEKALADQVRRDAIKRQADQSIKQGFCLMNGGGWGCGY